MRPFRAIALQMLESRRLLSGGTFNIEMTFDGEIAPAVQAVALQAAARWELAIVEDIPDVGRGPWGAAVDDLRLDVIVADIDGPGGTLATADPRYRRSGSNLPITGILTLDAADASNPGLLDIAVHEMGHLLGIGSLWSNFGLVSGAGTSNPVYTGVHALAEYRAYMGNPALASVPVESSGGLGTAEVHWRESTFARELMTGFYSTGFINPLSRMSIASLMDFGYPGVNPDAADAYNIAGGNPIPTIASLGLSTAVSAPDASLTLTANGVSNAGGTLADVRIYRETNGVTGLQASGNVLNKDTLVATITTGTPWQTTLDLTGLAEGTYTYYAQATDSHGAVSIVSLATHTIAAPPAAPVALQLDAASDSGISNADRITNVVLPTILGSAGANQTIRLFADAVEIGQTTSDVAGGWTFTPTAPLTDGTKQITAVAENAAGTSAPSDPLVITIDTIAPQVTASDFVYLTSLGVTVTFSEDVQASLSGDDLTFQNVTTSTPYAATLAGYESNTARFGFAAFPPPKGDYEATLLGSITDVAGNALAGTPTVPFFHLPGDINRSRGVDFDDLLILAQHYGQPGNYAQGDMNYNGVVDFDDLLMVAQNYGTSFAVMAPLETPKAATPATKRTPTAASIFAD